MVWQRMLRPSSAPEWRLVGQENYAAIVSGFFRRKRKSVSSRGDLFRQGARSPNWLPGIEPFPLFSAAPPKIGNVPSADLL
jgi:hypothetical protein